MRELYDAAVDLARGAAAIVKQKYHQELVVTHKGAVDLVTDADHASEAHLIAGIRARFPDHAILAEESGAGGAQGTVGDAGAYRWVLDPLDGTVNFAHKIPHFCVLVAVQKRTATGSYDTLLGVTIDPLRDEEFIAERGGGARLNGLPLRVSPATRLIDSVGATGFSYDRLVKQRDNHAEFCRLNLLTQGVRRFGSAGLDLAYVAAGRLAFFWEYDLNPWDLAPGVLTVQEAGGSVTALDGTDVPAGSGTLLATNGRVHQAMVAALRSVSDVAINSREGLAPHLPAELAAKLAEHQGD